MPFGFENAAQIEAMAVKRLTRGVATKLEASNALDTPAKGNTSSRARDRESTKVKEGNRRTYLSLRSRALHKIRKPPKSSSKEIKVQTKKWIESLINRDEVLVASSKTAKRPKATEDNEWEVEQILDSRHRQGKLEFFILWKGFQISESTWEPEDNLEHTQEIIDEYYEKFPNHPGVPGAKVAAKRRP